MFSNYLLYQYNVQNYDCEHTLYWMMSFSSAISALLLPGRCKTVIVVESIDSRSIWLTGVS